MGRLGARAEALAEFCETLTRCRSIRLAGLIATIPFGYDDGFPRALSNRGQVLVRGKFAPVVGRVSMDLTLIDVTDVAGVSLDDRVTLLGKEGELVVTAEDIAELAGTI